MQMQVLYMLYLDFRVFQLHFKSIRSSIMWLDQWLSSPIPNHYTGAPSAPSPQQCLQLSISTFGNNKGLSFGSFFALLIRQDPKFLLHRAHGSGLCLRTGRKVKYETGTRSASLPHRTGTRSGSFLHAEAGDSKQELADGCIVSWCPQPYGMRFGIPIKVGIKRSGYAGGTEHAEAGGESLEEEEIIPSDSSCGWWASFQLVIYQQKYFTGSELKALLKTNLPLCDRESKSSSGSKGWRNNRKS
ncbi:uncharacterized protein LOC134166098 isoform X2 [Pezoporus occidentalis]|uniref:uncharacterized protein LOC134166098 isoform X2 n=1 Tax=Pezoporus occidentalis TaxID=407982 RepID=UPI002F915EDA